MLGDDVTNQPRSMPPDNARCFGRFFYPPLKGLRLDPQCHTCARRNEAIMDVISTSKGRASTATVLPEMHGSVCLVRSGDWGW